MVVITADQLVTIPTDPTHVSVCPAIKESFQHFDVVGQQSLKLLKEKTNLTCEDVDECTVDLHGCDITKTACINTDGSYTCNCSTGYKGKFSLQ